MFTQFSLQSAFTPYQSQIVLPALNFPFLSMPFSPGPILNPNFLSNISPVYSSPQVVAKPLNPNKAYWQKRKLQQKQKKSFKKQARALFLSIQPDNSFDEFKETLSEKITKNQLVIQAIGGKSNQIGWP